MVSFNTIRNCLVKVVNFGELWCCWKLDVSHFCVFNVMFTGGEHAHSHDHHDHDHAHSGQSHSHSLKDLSVGLSILGG